MQQALATNTNQSNLILGRYRQPASYKCNSCNLLVDKIYLCDHVVDKTVTSYKLCSKELCRCCAVQWYGGADYCKSHLPTKKLGNIIVGSVREYDLTDGVYIGREVKTYRDNYPGSILANPYKIEDITDPSLNLDKYKREVLWDGIKKKIMFISNYANLETIY